MKLYCDGFCRCRLRERSLTRSRSSLRSPFPMLRQLSVAAFVLPPGYFFIFITPFTGVFLHRLLLTFALLRFRAAHNLDRTPGM